MSLLDRLKELLSSKWGDQGEASSSQARVIPIKSGQDQEEMGSNLIPRVREQGVSNPLGSGCDSQLSQANPTSNPTIKIPPLPPGHYDVSFKDGKAIFTKKETKLYWCCFMAPDHSFIGVVVCRGTSPGAAANEAIKSNLVESEQASIMLIPADKEDLFAPYINKLLNETEAREALELTKSGIIEKRIDISQNG